MFYLYEKRALPLIGIVHSEVNASVYTQPKCNNKMPHIPRKKSYEYINLVGTSK